MALQLFDGGGSWIPILPMMSPAFGSGTYLIDATGEYVALIFQCPKAGTLDRFDFNIATVTNSPDNGLRASFQGVDASGLPDGTILGSTNNAFVTYAHTVTTGWKSTNFGETATVTRGQMVAAVIQIPSFTASDSVTISNHNVGLAVAARPYGVSVTGSKQATAIPTIAVHYTDGYASLGPYAVAMNAFANTGAYNVDTAVADEWGMAFTVPFPCRIDGASVGIVSAAGANYECILYSAADSVLASVTIDGDHVSDNASTIPHMCWFTATVDLAASTLYRITVRPTTTANVTMQYFGFVSAEVMDTIEGGSSWYMTSRVNQAGSWTDYNSGTFRRPRMSLYLSACDDAVSAGGIGGRVIGGGF